MRMGTVPFLAVVLGALTLFFPSPSSGEMVLAVPDFQAVGCPQHLGGAVAEQIRGKLTGRGPWTVLESSQMTRIAAEHRLSMSGLVDDKKAVAVGKVLGAQYLVLGTVNAVGSVFTLTARFVDIATGVVHSGFQTVSHEGEEGLLKAAEVLTDDISLELGGS